MHYAHAISLALVFTLGSCQTAYQEPPAGPDVSYPDSGVLDLPFSDAVRVGNMLYVSGNVGNLPGTLDLAEGGIEGQTIQAFENIRSTLEKYGSSMDRVVKCTVMMDDISEWQAMNDIYATFFPKHKPARSTFGAAGLALGAKVEIECMATVS
jgi:2-iminobutanoate/2-iminopropanoate deaminase